MPCQLEEIAVVALLISYTNSVAHLVPFCAKHIINTSRRKCVYKPECVTSLEIFNQHKWKEKPLALVD